MRNNAVGLLIVATFATNALATPSELSGISIGELGKVQSETILLKAKAERAKAEREMKGEPMPSAQPVSTGVSNPFPAPQPMQYLPAESKAAAKSDLPVVKAVTGSARRMQATLLYSSGIVLVKFFRTLFTVIRLPVAPWLLATSSCCSCGA